MNSLVIVFISITLFLWGISFYARRLEKIWQIDPQRSTPAFAKYDGVDYIPSKNWLVLFGHHFASIAGAGPIVGPVIACVLWGWLPALIWVILGTIFIGGVHDFGALITSVREGGSSITDIAGAAISKRARIIFSLFVWLALILVIAVFTYLCADTFVNEPRIVLPSLGLIPVSILVGFLLYNLKTNSVLTTVLGLTMLTCLITWGGVLPIQIPANAIVFWIVILLIYSYFASILPVNLLLQPRDYLSSFLLFFGLIVGFLGLLIQHPNINTPAYIKFNASEGFLWPMMCVTVACGAISGFHSLVASGTSSKQLSNERYAKIIGYGGMVAEGLVAVLAILAICSGLNLKEISSKANPITLFGSGYANITKSVLSGYGGLIAITILNAFILTTLDTATRITRYLSEELLRIKNRYFSTLVIILLAGLLALSKDRFNNPLWKKIWPAFGASNQLVAAFALLVITCWLLSRNKPIRYTIIPAIFMLLTTISALILQIGRYSVSHDYLLLIISIVLLLSALFMIYEVISVYRKMRAKCQRS